MPRFLTKLEYLIYLEEIIELINEKLKHDLKIKFTEYTFDDKEDNGFNTDVTCNRCGYNFEIDMVGIMSYYDNKYKDISFAFSSIQLFTLDLIHEPENNCMKWTCEELLIKQIIE
jgi:hypothetical protein